MPLRYDSLPAQLLALLQAGRAVTVRWDCGSDEHIVTTQLDGVEQAFDLGEDYHYWMFAEHDVYEDYLSRITNLPVLLGDFVAKLLRLPSVGDFHMQGGGQVLLENDGLWLEFQSDATSYMDDPDGWWPEEYPSTDELAGLFPEYYLSTDELAELFPERLIELVAWHGMARQPTRQPDPELAAAYTGRELLFRLS